MKRKKRIKTGYDKGLFVYLLCIISYYDSINFITEEEQLLIIEGLALINHIADIN